VPTLPLIQPGMFMKQTPLSAPIQPKRSSTVRVLPLQLVLIIPFVLQILGAVGLVGYLSFKNGETVVQDLSEQLMKRTSSEVDHHLDAYLSIPHKVNQINADAIRMGLLNVRDRKTIGKYFWHQLQAYDLTYISLSLPTGESAGAGRYDGKTVTIDDDVTKTPSLPKNVTTYLTDKDGNRTQILATATWDTLKEPSYTEPVKAGKPIWTGIYTYNDPAYPPYIAASAGRPVYDASKKLIAVVGVDIHLLKLSEFLRTLDVSRSGQVLIMERDGMLVANSGQEQPFTVTNNEIKRIKATDSPNPVVQGIAKQLQQSIPDLKSITNTQKLNVNFKGEKYHVDITPWHDEYGLDWLVVTTVPESTFMAQINANTQTTILLCLGALVVATAIGIFTSRWIARPILRLNQASEAIASGHLDQTVKESNIQEFNILAHSFNRMAGQLHNSFIALEKSNVNLEERVEERTAELQLAIKAADAANQTKSELVTNLELEIIERQQSEIALQNQTSLMQLILNSMSDGVIVADENGQFLIFNPAAEQMFGRITDTQQEEWADQYGLFQPDQVTPIPTEQIPLVRATQGEHVDNLEIFTRHRQAPEGFWITVSGRPLKDTNSVLKGGVVVCRNISERKSAELEILQAKEAAEVANRTKSEFLANMNHELRTPLNGILGYAQIIQRDPTTTEKQQKGLSVIHQCGSHLLTLINDILDLSKLEVQKMDLYPQDFHLANFLTTTVEICRIKAQQKGVAFHYQPDANLPTAVHADDKRLRQVLLNLLSNAAKFTDFGSVTFTVSVLPDSPNLKSKIYKIRFQVEDTGIGVAPEKLAAIFLPFEQAGKRDRNSEGTGLGLAISQQIVQKMGSTIQVKSILGKGSTFWFEVDLPTAADWLSQAATAHQKVIGYQGERRKILVIDDRRENRAVVMGMLAPLGFKLTEADDGQTGLDVALQMRPDLIITDVMMSQMTGLEMTRRLRQLPDFVHTPIIVSPATLSQVDLQEAMDAGCNSFFPKPIEFTGLLSELQRHLELQWIYEILEETVVASVADNPTDWVVPPVTELVVLYQAAQDGFMADIQREASRLKQLDDQYAPFANKLLELSQMFDDEALINLLAPHV
jgi:PAS domain S-box-containing protein